MDMRQPKSAPLQGGRSVVSSPPRRPAQWRAADIADWRHATLRLRFLAWTLLLIASGCVGKPNAPRFDPATLPSFSAGGSQYVPDRWWTEFADPGLDAQVNLALGDSFDLAAALQQVRAARAVTQREASDFYPDVNGFLEHDDTFGPGRNRSRTNWGLDASFQVDLWGQIQSRVDAERLRAQATEADYQTVALTLSAEIARTWFALIESFAQLDLLAEQVDTNRKGLKAVELRFGVGGGGGSPNVLRQRQLVQSTLEQMIVVRSDIEVLEHRLAVLTGRPPQTAAYRPGAVLPSLPPLPVTGPPSELIARRPDIRGDYLAFVAADRDLQAAVTDQYPRLDLRASLVNAAEHPEALFRDWFLSLGGQLVGPLVDGGQRRAEIVRTHAIVCQRFQQYRQTIQVALQEVEDGLAREQFQIQRIEKLETQVELAKLASEQLRQRFITGDATYLDILSAVQSQQRLQRTLLSARLEQILIRIGLYLALAGDFDTRPVTPVNLSPELPELPLPAEPGAVEVEFEAAQPADQKPAE